MIRARQCSSVDDCGELSVSISTGGADNSPSGILRNTVLLAAD